MPHTLLLADDSITIQRVIELTFADEDIRVVAVSDGKQAVQRAQIEAPDIVLADVGMPEMDGYEVAAFIKGTPGLSHVPVLLLTGAFEPVDDQRARAAGCDGVLVKPFEPQMVISRVKELIARRPAAASLPPVPSGPLPGHAAASPAFVAPPPATDEYFDRLDAALSNFDSSAPTMAVPAPAMNAPGESVQAAATPPPSGPAAAPAALPEPVRAEPVLPSAAAERPDLPSVIATPAPPMRTLAEPPAAPPPHPTSAPSPLAEAFEALLAAEQGRPLESAAARHLGSSDTLIDHITKQVIARLADDRMRDVVIEVAERLVREEIARIKSAAS